MKDYDLLRLKSFMSVQHKLVMSFYVNQEPFRKGKSTNGSSSRQLLIEEFKKELRVEMKQKHIRNMKTDVAVDFYFSSSKENHPDHANLIKNYIDIIRDNLLDDDRQVSVIESYHSLPRSRHTPKGSLRVRISPLGLYKGKSSLLRYYSDSNEKPYSNRQSSEDMSPAELVTLYKDLLVHTKSRESRDAIRLLMKKAEEEKVLGHLWSWDFPFELKKSGQEDWLGMNDILSRCRSEQVGIVVALPYTTESISKATQKHLLERGVASITVHTTLDINVEVINWQVQDIDNIFVDVKKAIFNSKIYTGGYTGVRIYRYNDDINPSQRLRIKLLPSMDIFFHVNSLEESVKEAFKDAW